MKNFWTKKKALSDYLDFVAKTISEFSSVPFDQVKAIMLKDIEQHPFSDDELDKLLATSEEEIYKRMKEMHDYLNGDSDTGLI